MTRPEGIVDPREPNAPIRVDDLEEDRNRSSISLADLLADPDIRIWSRHEVVYERLSLPEIDPGRLAYLRRRRDEILAEIRAGGGLNGGE